MGPLAVRTEGLSKRYGRVRALDDLGLEVAQGEVVGYLGPNGAGKTTTIRLLLGLIRPSAGRAEIFGLDCQRQVVEAHRHLAYVAGEANLWPSLTGAETLHLLGRVQGSVRRGLSRTSSSPVSTSIASKKVRAYSKGNRQKLILIAALMTRAALLVLDEPTSGLDPLMEQAFRECVHEARERGQTVFLSSHILSEVEALCDRVGILREGVLVEMGTLAEMRHLSALSVEATFEAEVPDLSGIPGVSSVRGRRARRPVPGARHDRAPLEGAGGGGVRELLSREPSLEELFLALYGAGEGRGGPPPARRPRRGPPRWRSCRLTRPAARPVAGPSRRRHRAPRPPHGARAARSGALWGCVFGAYLATQALAYASSYKTLAQRERLAKRSSASNAGISALVGPGSRAFRRWPASPSGSASPSLAVVGAVWGLLTGTRLLRGEEDAGRWELLLAGQTTRRGAAAPGPRRPRLRLARASWPSPPVITVVVGRSSKVQIGTGRALFLALSPS